MFSLLSLLRNLYLLSLLYADATVESVSAQRWGQASALVSDVLFVYGGKTDEYNAFSYTSAPNNNDLLMLSLTQSFDLSQPPWKNFSGSTSQGPSVAWASLSAYGTSQLLLLGGAPSQNSPTFSDSGSAAILNINDKTNPQWSLERDSWANQPQRRIYHSASSTGGKIWITGGLIPDGSKMASPEYAVFDPQSLKFTSLPTDGAPPSIYGHASIVLPNGSLIVFGGCLSDASMIPFSTIWMLNTTTLQWTSLSVSATNLPTPRRGFAATFLDPEMILIHGGSDAMLQTTYSDGWVLDTSQNPMVWSPVDLSPLGARRDHLAVAVGHTVLFAFGYGSSSPARTGLQLYDKSTGSWSTSFSPLPLPNGSPSPSQSNTALLQPGSTYTSGQLTSSDWPQSSNPTSTGYANHVSKTKTIILGTVCGLLGLAIVAAWFIYYSRRRHRQSESLFQMLSDPEGENSRTGRAIPVAGTVGRRLSLFGFVDRNAPMQRRDMLADEDTRYFNIREASGQDSIISQAISEKVALPIQDSRASVRLVGGLFSTRARNTSQGSRASSWEEEEQDLFPDHAVLMANERPASTFSGHSLPSPTFADPFAARDVNEYREDDLDALSIDMDYYGSTQMETSQQSSLLHSSESLDHSTRGGHSTIGQSSSEEASRTRRSSILDAPNPSPTRPMRRSDSWWGKFTKTSFLDRRLSDESRSPQFVEFRDPNPPPRLGAIKEMSYDAPSRNSETSSVGNVHLRIYSEIEHGRSASSLRTAQTANSEALENIGEMDIVQRDSVGSRYIRTEEPGSRKAPAMISADTRALHEAEYRISRGDGVSESADSSSVAAAHMSPSSGDATTLSGTGRAASKRVSSGGVVSSRVQTFEQRILLDTEASNPVGAAMAGEIVAGKGRDRRSIKYGFAPRPSLFVANPGSHES